MNLSPRLADNQFQLWFRPLSSVVRGYAFPCDAAGGVDLDALHGRQRLDYLFARALIGRDFDWPRVCQSSQQQFIAR